MLMITKMVGWGLCNCVFMNVFGLVIGVVVDGALKLVIVAM